MFEALPKAMRIQLSKVRESLRTRILGRAILYFRELPSTNEIAKELAVGGIGEGAVVVAETQTVGRGRFKREWASPEGGLWFSVVLRPKVQPKQAPKLTLLASVAVAKTINRLYGLRAEIKWPNDVLVNQKKVCGILTEGQTRDGTLNFAILGIGINANFNIEAFSPPLRETATTLKEELGRDIEREILFCRLLGEVESYYELLQRGKLEAILNDWRRLTGFLGSYVVIQSDGGKVEGWAVDLDNDGALIVKLKDEALVRVTSGDIVKIIHREYPRHVDE